MLALVEEGIRVVVVDLTCSLGHKIRKSLQELGDNCPRLILIMRPGTEPAVGGPFPLRESGSPIWTVYPVDPTYLEVLVQSTLESLGEEQESDEDVVAKVQSKIDAAVERARKFEESTHLEPGDEDKRVVI